jgi:hypothetical protein
LFNVTLVKGADFMKKIEDTLLLKYQEIETVELLKNLTYKKERFKIAKENYEFEYAAMLIEEIKEIQSEIQRRRKAS